jgi:bacillithiol biosynthesis cysteine-adding enzyme BshC
VRTVPGIRKLAADYTFAFPALSRFFPADPAQPASWRDAIARVQATDRARGPLADLLLAQQARRRAGSEAQSAVALLRNPRTVAVVTGQQAGLFGGPVFTLLKALTAIKLAHRIRTEYDTPAVAVFWVEAEDHDWDEVRTCTVLDADLQARRVALAPPPGAGEVPVGSLRLDDTVAAALGELEAALPATEFTAPLLAALGDAYQPGHGMADAFARWLEAQLGSRGLVVFESCDPACKPLVGRVFGRELEEPGRTAQLAARAGSRLVELGYHAQVTPQAGPALFHLDGRRSAVRREDDRYIVGDTTCGVADLRVQVAAQPAAFSANVLLRPIVQDTLFPTVCYVAGPNELAYHAQLREIYEHFDVPMPLYYPRASATILDAGAVRFLSRYELPLDTFHAQDDSALNRLLESQLPATVEDTFHDAVRIVEERMSALASAVPAIDPTLEAAARSTLGKMQHELKALHGKIIQSAKRRDETLRRQFERVRAQAFPGGEAQERAIGSVSFLARYGPALVDRLDDELPLEMGRHWIVTP